MSAWAEILIHLPDFFRLLPLKKSSSSSSSNRPPPPPPLALAPAGICLGVAGAPFSLLPTESESFPVLNRWLSAERRGLGRSRKTQERNIDFPLTKCSYQGKLKRHRQESSFQVCQNLEHKTGVMWHFNNLVSSIFFLYPLIYRIPCTFFFRQSVLPVLFRLSLRTFLSSDTGGFGASENRSP